MAQVVEPLPGMGKVLSSNPRTTKKKLKVVRYLTKDLKL
jgi:hypothetical protein